MPLPSPMPSRPTRTALALLLACMPAWGRADEVPSDRYVAAAGIAGVRSSLMGTGAVGYYWGNSRGHGWHHIDPGLLVGFVDHARYFSVQLSYPVWARGRWMVALGTGPGLYERDLRAPNLGSDIEFFTNLSVRARLTPRVSMGLGVGHLSNAHLAPYNPGSNVAYLIIEAAAR
jgi:hypothetical protein